GDFQRVSIVVVLLEQPRVASGGPVDGDLLPSPSRRTERRREDRGRGDAFHACLSRTGRALSTPSRIPLMNCDERGVENLLAISSASSMMTGRGVVGSSRSSQ